MAGRFFEAGWHRPEPASTANKAGAVPFFLTSGCRQSHPPVPSGEMTMLSARNGTILIITASAVLCTAWYNPVQAPDEANLRKKALSLNNVTGEDPIKGEIQALVDDAAGTRQLLAVATKMAGEKPQPFNYNGAFVLAQAALRL